MKTALIACSLLASSQAFATPVEDMVKLGFACESGVRGEVICSKEGAPSKICNGDGSCFRIVYDGSQKVDAKIVTGSVGGRAYSNTEY